MLKFKRSLGWLLTISKISRDPTFGEGLCKREGRGFQQRLALAWHPCS